nr:MAG TPA: hypothetical protein [Caudoviricetes sp.]
MREIDAPFIPPRAEIYRAKARELAASGRAVEISDRGELREFLRAARDCGLFPRQRKVSGIGWHVWVFDSGSAHIPRNSP